MDQQKSENLSPEIGKDGIQREGEARIKEKWEVLELPIAAGRIIDLEYYYMYFSKKSLRNAESISALNYRRVC